jgi:hypothetical protein
VACTSAVAMHAWEQHQHEWERSDSENSCGWGSDSDDAADADLSKLSAEEAGDVLAQHLIDLQSRGVLSARWVCTLVFFAKRAGAAGFVGKVAFNPNSNSGHFQRHLESVLLHKQERRELYEFQLPGHTRYDKYRCEHTFHALPLHEQLASELAENPDMNQRFDELKANQEWPDQYYSHRLVRSYPGERVWPLSLYLDGVAYSNIDNVLGITISNMVSGTRHLCVTLRKALICRCGCRGWCTLWSIWRYVGWCINALSAGTFPTSRHDFRPWSSTDEIRESLAGCSLGMRGAIVQIRGDWGEFTKSLGMVNWAHTLRP